MSITTVEEQFATAMLSDATVAGYFGGPHDPHGASPGRLYDTQLPQNVSYPCAAYQRISTRRIQTHGAPDNNGVFQGNNQNAGFTRFQITVWSDVSANQARQATQALVDALRSFNAWDGTTRGPNQILNQHGGVEPQTQPPIPFQRFDVLIPFADFQ